MKWILVWVLFFCGITAHAGKRALIYRGPGACADGCYDAAFQVAIQAGLDPVFVSEKELHDGSTPADEDSLFKEAAVWIQPGGKSKTVMESITVELKSALDRFLNSGGGYVGFCAGAFAATNWVGTSWTHGFGYMPGSTELYRVPSHQAEIIPIRWNGKVRSLYWEGGPELSRLGGRAEVIGLYPTGSVAAARGHYGKGRVFVTGLHPEAPEDWRTYYGLTDPDGLDQDLAVEMIHWAVESL